MKNWKIIPIPARMRNLEIDKRGFPIPYIIMKDASGTPHFTINKDTLVEKCIKDNKCQICGKILRDDKWMIGGPQSAFHPQGVYIDTPVHKSCGIYALQVCPYLAFSSYNGKLTIDDINEKNFNMNTETKKLLFVNPTISKDRVPFFVFSKIESFEVRRHGPGLRYIVPKRPYLEIEYWDDGEQITKEQAISKTQ